MCRLSGVRHAHSSWCRVLRLLLGGAHLAIGLDFVVAITAESFFGVRVILDVVLYGGFC